MTFPTSRGMSRRNAEWGLEDTASVGLMEEWSTTGHPIRRQVRVELWRMVDEDRLCVVVCDFTSGTLMGSGGFMNTIERMHVSPGGVSQFVMHDLDCVDYPNEITYLKIKTPERLVYNHDEEGQLGYFQVTVTFEEVGKKTKLSMQLLFQTKEQLKRSTLSDFL